MWEPDPQLIERASRGDTAAFELLVRGYLPDVYRFARHLVRDFHLAEDVSQEALIKAHQHLKGFRGQSKFSTWLFRITRNCAVDAIRRGARQRRIAEHIQPREATDISIKVSLDDAVASLPIDLRESFVMIEVFGFSYEETSAILGVPSGTLKSRMYRTRRLLIDALQDQEDAGEV